ncbi:MAG TPA: Gfo/Idh/MocA family oxidoreductase [Clostridiales bacterium]|nr:Gfo/Idh/MocA family oxidoreductase [Clostridiales bacterium]
MKVKWGVIGAGGIADRRTLPGMMLAKNAELVAVMEVNMELAEKLRAKYNAKRAYDNVDAILADPEVEAVYIASPVIYHKDAAVKAAKAKKHILIEKPVALTADEGEKIAALCKEEGIKVAVGLMMRYHAYHQKMKEIIESGKLGKVVSCRAQLTCWYPDIPGNWRQQKSTSGGGALMDMGVHCADLIQYITGGKATKVAALTGTKTFNYEVEDQASVIFEMDNGAYAYVDSNFNIPDAAARCRFEIYGTKGSMLAEGTISQIEGGKLDVVLSDDSLAYDAKQDRVDVSTVKIDVEFGNMYTKEIESFSNSILNNGKIEVPIEDALQVQRLIESAYKSSEKGVFVNL